MRRFAPVLSIACILALAAAGRADITQTFSTNPLGGGAIVQGPDAANVNSRFTYNSGQGTLTAHYNSTSPTIKLLFPLGNHFNQNDTFKVSTTFAILGNGFLSPPDFGGQVPSFGLVNSATTGNVRATTSTAAFTEVTQGNAYDAMTFDYFPTQDNTFGGNSVSLTTIQSAQAGESFNSRFKFGYATTPLPLDQFISAVLIYNGSTHQASLNWGTGSLTSDLTGAVFNVDSFAITLWQDPNLAPSAPAVVHGSPVGGDILFDSFSVVSLPEPGSVALLLGGTALLLARRRSR
ncbi:MAG TPA: PEP-CTERM sorting domain-containing protein [Phycisphaerae bacterium]|nr:PEP-CTERM sorting domain-containing protein [Phycisphaerae bacterium]